jgi:hypothetical protein
VNAGAQIRPRPLFCVVEHAHASRAVAEEVCAGKFTENGTTLELGLNPNWQAGGLNEDEEWQIAWIKFYFGLHLATAFAETGELRFQYAWESLVDSWIRQAQPDLGPADAFGRRIQNWIYAWNIFASSPHFRGFNNGLEERIVVSLAQQTGHLINHLEAERNHRTLELYALLVAALALPEMPGSEDLLKFSMNAIHENLLTDVRTDGVHREHSTHYHMLVLRTYLAARENARRFGLNFPAEYDVRLELACEFAMHCRRPDGQIPALSDADTGSYADLLQLAAGLFSRPDFLYAGTAGAQGVPPRRRYVNFPEAGYYIQRSGWGEGKTALEKEKFLVFDCGALGDGGHGHYDLLSVEISANGKPLIQDPGRYSYSEHEPNFRRWFKGTAAHNTVCIDGLDQVPYRRGKPKPPLPECELIARWSAPGFDVIQGKAKSGCYEAVHTRSIFLIGDEYWIIHDVVQGDRPHRFDLRFHLAPDAWEKTDISRGDIALAHGLALVFNPGSKLQLEQGWIAPQYGVKYPAPVVSAVIEGRNNAEFITLVLPQEGVLPQENDRPIPQLKICHGANDDPGTFAVEVHGTGQNHDSIDFVTLNAPIADHNFGPLQCSASAIWVRKTHGDTSLHACNVSELKLSKSPQPSFAQREPAPWIKWNVKDGLTLGSKRFE